MDCNGTCVEVKWEVAKPANPTQTSNISHVPDAPDSDVKTADQITKKILEAAEKWCKAHSKSTPCPGGEDCRCSEDAIFASGVAPFTMTLKFSWHEDHFVPEHPGDTNTQVKKKFLYSMDGTVALVKRHIERECVPNKPDFIDLDAPDSSTH